MSEYNYCTIAKQIIVEEFGQYTLAKLLSGRWAAIWTACFSDEGYCESILTEVFFNDATPSFATKKEALKKIVDLLQEKINRTTEGPVDWDKPHLCRALKSLLATDRTEYGISTELKKSKAPEAWKDIFILSTSSGRYYLVPCQSVCLVESKSNVWIIRTMFGDFLLNGKGSAYDQIIEGQREFDVTPTTLELELLKF